MSNKIKLFNESDQEESEPVEFRTNKSYAKHYDEFRKKEVLGYLKSLDAGEGGSSDSSDDETTDEEIVDAEFDKEFFRTLAFLKRNDPNKYAEKPQFFEHVKPVEEVALTKRHHKEKPLTLKDYERKVILEKGGVYEDEEDVDADSSRMQPRAESPSLVEQQKRIKDEIKEALSKVGESDSDGDEEDPGKARGGGLLKERTKSKDENAKEQADYIEWLADKKAKEPPSEDVKVLEPLKHFWSNKNLSKEDAFLKDYILNKRFLHNEDIPSYDDIVATSEDDEVIEQQEEYERKYNFRFEEPDPEFIKRYPRTVDDSVRIERNKRKEQRQALKERKQKEKEQQRRELEELKAVKLQEIRDRIQRLKEIAATEKLTMNEDDLDSEFDPAEHDRRMHEMFDDEYYGVDEGDQKPDCPDLDEELGIENYDKEHIPEDGEGDAGPHCEDDDFVMDCDYDKQEKSGKETLQQELLDSTKGRKKKGRRQSKFREMLKAEKPLFDPEDEKTYGQYIDEYYKLDYEDMIGDTPCRFRYVETVPNDFGLSIEEILAANTRELNRWASVKKTVQLRPKQTELREIETYRRKGSNEGLKRKLLPSLFIETDITDDEDEEIKKQKQNVKDTESKSENEKLSKKREKKEQQATISEASTVVIAKQEKKKKKLKEKVSLEEAEHNDRTVVETNEEQKANISEQPVKEKKKKKSKKDQQITKDEPDEECATSMAGSTGKSKAGTDDRTNQKHTNGRINEPVGGSNSAQKRKWNQTNATVSAGESKAWNGAKKQQFGRNGRQNGQQGGAKPYSFGQKGFKTVESASDQRLRDSG